MLGESHGSRSLGGGNPWSCKKSDMTEATEHSTHTIIHTHTLTHVGFPGGSAVKNLHANAGDVGSIPGSNIFQYSCWLIPWTEKPGGLQFIRSQSWISLNG